MAKAPTTTYGNDSISMLKGAERVRKRPGVIFGSDGLDGCEHAVFEILSNSIDEAREGHGKVITLTHYADGSIEVGKMYRAIQGSVWWVETLRPIVCRRNSACGGRQRWTTSK